MFLLAVFLLAVPLAAFANAFATAFLLATFTGYFYATFTSYFYYFYFYWLLLFIALSSYSSLTVCRLQS